MKKVSKAVKKKPSRSAAAKPRGTRGASAVKRPARAATSKVAPRKKPAKRANAGREVWLPEGLRDYAVALQTHGMLTGVVGKQRFAEDVASVLDVLHRILAGGELGKGFRVKGAVNDRVKGKLDRLSKRLVRELNAFRTSDPMNVKYG